MTPSVNSKILTALFTPTANSRGSASTRVAGGAYSAAAGNPGGAAALPTLAFDSRFSGATTTQLNDTGLATLPTSQGWLAFGSGFAGSHTVFTAGTTLIATALLAVGAGYSNHSTRAAMLINIAFPALNASLGFSLDLRLFLISDSQASRNRAGFYLTFLEQNSTPKGVELGCWTTSIFSQARGAATFTSVVEWVDSEECGRYDG